MLAGRDELPEDWAVTQGVELRLTGGRIRGDRDVARANLEEARLRAEQTRELAEVDAAERPGPAGRPPGAVAGERRHRGAGARAYQIAEIRYREGISTQTELDDLRIEQAQAQVNRAQAARDLQVARIRLVLLPALPLTAQAAAATVVPTSLVSARLAGNQRRRDAPGGDPAVQVAAISPLRPERERDDNDAGTRGGGRGAGGRSGCRSDEKASATPASPSCGDAEWRTSSWWCSPSSAPGRPSRARWSGKAATVRAGGPRGRSSGPAPRRPAWSSGARSGYAPPPCGR